MTPFKPSGKTISFTAATTAPTAVRVFAEDGVPYTQIMLTNVDADTDAFIVYSAISSADAIEKDAVPTGTAQWGFPLLARSQVVVTLPAGYRDGIYITGATGADTAVIYCTPGYGV